MRKVRMGYRVHMTSMLSGAQWYSGQHLGAPNGWIFPEREDAEAWVARVRTEDRLADIEEYEYTTEEDEHA